MIELFIISNGDSPYRYYKTLLKKSSSQVEFITVNSLYISFNKVCPKKGKKKPEISFNINTKKLAILSPSVRLSKSQI